MRVGTREGGWNERQEAKNEKMECGISEKRMYLAAEIFIIVLDDTGPIQYTEANTKRLILDMRDIITNLETKLIQTCPIVKANLVLVAKVIDGAIDRWW